MSTGIQKFGMTSLKTHEETKRKASARLASGQAINRASEGAAELSAASSLKSTARATSAALSNANRGVALGQVADGAMSQIQDLLLRMKELAVSSASDTFGDNDRTAANKELQTLSTGINDIATRTRYSGKALLDGTAGQLDIQTGEDATDTTFFTPSDVQSSTIGVDALDISSKAGAVSAQATIDDAIVTLAAARSIVGSFMVGLEASISVNQVKSENLDAAISVFTEADVAKEATNLAMAEILTQMALGMISKQNQAASNLTGLIR